MKLTLLSWIWLVIFAFKVTTISEAALTGCYASQFQCKSDNKCISASWRCDSDADCNDGSDEDDCELKPCRPEDEFQCANRKCIPLRWHCDGEIDCTDESDENTTSCNQKNCRDDQFKCNQTGQCIPEAWVCDDQEDCPLGEDEQQCVDRTCTGDNHFQCGDGRCVVQSWRCDGEQDCSDGSDEKNCSTEGPPTCASSEFTCPTGHQRCIPLRWMCDGDRDCDDGADEHQNCTRPTVNPCHDDEWTCKNGDCIVVKWMCDGTKDCIDGSDEEICPNITCARGDFKCDAHQCISGTMKCDRSPDCVNGKDEEDCPTPPPACDAETEFDCEFDNRQCIPRTQVCNRQRDCASGSDEALEMCRDDPCLHNNGGCSEECVRDYLGDHHNGYHCACKKGEKLDADRKSCVDINECAEILGACSQICVNTKGSYKCDCREGYWLEGYTSCRAEGQEPALLFANRRDIRKIKIHSGEFSPLVESTRSAVAIDYDLENNMFYWSDVADEKIYALPLNATDASAQKVIVDRGIRTVDGIAIDWVHQNLYWTDTGFDTISVVDLKSEYKYNKTLFNSDLEEPRAIVVDPRPDQMRMYWSDWGRAAKIESAFLDGSDRKAIVSGNAIAWPNGISIDVAQNRLYWVDAKLHQIASCKLDGTGIQVVLLVNRYLQHPFALAVFEDNVYWTDWEYNAIYSTYKFKRNDPQVNTVVQGLNTPMDIHVMHPLQQDSTLTPPPLATQSCSHMYLPRRQTVNEAAFVCVCPDAPDHYHRYDLLSDGKTCHLHDLRGGSGQPVDGDGGATGGATGSDSSATGTGSSSSNASASASDSGDSAPSARKMGTIAPIVVGVLALMIIIGIVIGCIVYRSYMKKNVRSMNFDNPVYRKTTDDQISLEKNQYQPGMGDGPSSIPLTAQTEEMA